MNQSHHLYKAALFKALGHPLRLAILDALRDGEKTVTQLQDLTGAEQASLSQHLKVLRTQHIVNFRRQGTLTYYRNEDAAVYLFLDLGKKVYQNQLQRQRQYLDDLQSES
ncbi:ArsR/SmtB family transcription factor [Deinococcus sp. VB343]|uniref:Metalloregulator ArsR/SmtB family transcription factor n=1 Tax=Deinococcus sp. VB142 TaxID=3112952 RepID=A0AAU6Q4P2_9DEIO